MVAMKELRLIFSLRDPPVMTPFSTRQILGSKSHPSRDFPSNREVASRADDRAQKLEARSKVRIKLRIIVRRLDQKRFGCHVQNTHPNALFKVRRFQKNRSFRILAKIETIGVR